MDNKDNHFVGELVKVSRNFDVDKISKLSILMIFDPTVNRVKNHPKIVHRLIAHVKKFQINMKIESTNRHMCLFNVI